MSQIVVTFERSNLTKTLEYIRQQKLEPFEEVKKPILEEHLVSEVKKILSGEMTKWGKKDYRFFEHLLHFPITGVACTYYLGDIPNDVGASFVVDVNDEGGVLEDNGCNIVACLYTFLG